MRNPVEKEIVEKEERREKRLAKDRRDSLVINLLDYNAKLLIIISGHSSERIQFRNQSTRSTIEKKLQRFFSKCSEEIIFELLCCSQELEYYGISFEKYAFILKGYLFETKKNKRITYIKLLTCADEEILGHQYKFKDVSAVFTETSFERF